VRQSILCSISYRVDDISRVQTYPLRLPRFLQEAVAKIAQREGTTIDQFIAIAVAEKLSAHDIQTFFEECRFVDRG
jgi:hypothetical protein